MSTQPTKRYSSSNARNHARGNHKVAVLCRGAGSLQWPKHVHELFLGEEAALAAYPTRKPTDAVLESDQVTWRAAR
eukprot:5002569-Amphidinium_carterae.1